MSRKERMQQPAEVNHVDFDKMPPEQSVRIRTEDDMTYIVTPKEFDNRCGANGNMCLGVHIKVKSGSVVLREESDRIISRRVEKGRTFRIYKSVDQDGKGVIDHEPQRVVSVEIDGSWDGLAKHVRF